MPFITDDWSQAMIFVPDVSEAEEVQAAAAWIDSHHPNGRRWRSEIDTGRLYMLDPAQCVLGQAWRDVPNPPGRYFRHGFGRALAALGYEKEIYARNAKRTFRSYFLYGFGPGVFLGYQREWLQLLQPEEW